MPGFDIAVFSYPDHAHHVAPLIRSIQAHVPGYNQIRIIWDDCNIQQFEFEDIPVIKHSDWHWSQKLWAHGWIRQQILKLRCHEFSHADYTWVVDSDIRICRAFDLFDPDAELPYLRYQPTPIDADQGCYRFMQQYFGIKSVHDNIIANGGGNCVFDHEVLHSMDQYCRAHNGGSLTDVLHQLMSQFSDQELNQWRGYPFSEFETYGNWVHQNCADRVIPALPNWSLHNNDQDIRVF